MLRRTFMSWVPAGIASLFGLKAAEAQPAELSGLPVVDPPGGLTPAEVMDWINKENPTNLPVLGFENDLDKLFDGIDWEIFNDKSVFAPYSHVKSRFVWLPREIACGNGFRFYGEYHLYYFKLLSYNGDFYYSHTLKYTSKSLQLAEKPIRFIYTSGKSRNEF